MSEDVKERCRKMWAEVDRRHVEAKDSQGATPELYGRYEELNDAERKQVKQVLFEALEKGRESEHYDALAIINRFKVVGGLEPLRRLAIRLQLDDSPPSNWQRYSVSSTALWSRARVTSPDEYRGSAWLEEPGGLGSAVHLMTLEKTSLTWPLE